MDTFVLEQTAGGALLSPAAGYGKVQGQMEEEKVWPSLSGLRTASICQLVRASGAHRLNVSAARMLLSYGRKIYSYARVS